VHEALKDEIPVRVLACKGLFIDVIKNNVADGDVWQ
jgi:hypothetical protein